MKIDKLIKTRRSVRKYKQIKISRKQITAILEAARWSPSAHNSQPWRFIVIRNSAIINNLSEILSHDCDRMLIGFNIVLKEAAKIVRGAPLVVVVYDSCELSDRMKKFGGRYYSITKISEIQSVAAAIQNMLLRAHSMGIGSAWLTSPLFSEKKIMNSFQIKGSLIAIVTFGYPDQKSTSKRKALKQLVKIS